MTSTRRLASRLTEADVPKHSLRRVRVLRSLILVSLTVALLGGLAALGARPAGTEEAFHTLPVPRASRHGAGLPLRVRIPRLSVDVPVQPGVYDAVRKTWNVSQTTAHFATVTALPNATAGKTLVYAHNTKRLFGPTARVQPGDEVRLVTETGAEFTYVYTGDDVVAPTDTDVFSEPTEGPPQLVLLTCSGSWNQKRRLLRFDLVRFTL